MTKTDKWVNCPWCGHRMFKWIDGQWTLEVKCPSCKRITVLEGGEQNVRIKRPVCELSEA
jgi:phage FluMu protein Com